MGGFVGVCGLKVKARQGKAKGRQRHGKQTWVLHARTHAVTHSLPRRVARQQKRVQRAIRRPTIRAAQSHPEPKSGVERLPSCLQKFAIDHPIPRALHLLPQSLPSRYDRSPLFSFSLHIFPQPSPLCLSEIPIPSFPRSQPPPKWLSPSRTSGLKSPWPRKLQHLSQSPSPPFLDAQSHLPQALCLLSPRPPSTRPTTAEGKKNNAHQL